MKSTFLWNQFLKTGAVEDYLSYRNTGLMDSQSVYHSGRIEGQEKTDAELSNSNRYGNQSGTNRGIR